MIKFVAFNFQDHGAWAKEYIKCVLSEDMKGIVALRGDEIVGAMLGDSWSHTSVNVHVGLVDPMCLKHKMLEEFCYYVFVTCGKEQMIGVVPATNEKALKFDKHIGFKEVVRIPDGFDHGVDYVVMTYLKSECKYIPQELREAA